MSKKSLSEHDWNPKRDIGLILFLALIALPCVKILSMERWTDVFRIVGIAALWLTW